jgi:hypothetical protein
MISADIRNDAEQHVAVLRRAQHEASLVAIDIRAGLFCLHPEPVEARIAPMQRFTGMEMR